MDWRARREAVGLTRREVAYLAGVNARTLQRIEQGRVRATPGVAAWLAWIYHREARRRAA